jgi:hypothetical protein
MNTALTPTANQPIAQLGAVDDAFLRAAAQQGGIESLSEGIGSSYAILGYRGKTWSLRYKGEVHNFIRQDDGTPAGHIDCIILRQAKVKAKSFYENFDPNAFEGKPPICASMDGIMPDEGVVGVTDNTGARVTVCALCPKNEWYVNAKGIKTKDCSDYKRIAVLLMPAQTKLMLGEALMEPVFLRIPAGSLQSLSLFGDEMARQGRPYFSFVTRITFDPEASHPKFVFRAIQALSADEAPVVVPLLDDEQSRRIVGEDQGSRRAMRQIAPPAPAPKPEPPLTTGLAAPQQQQPVQEVILPPKKEDNLTLFGAAKPSTLAVPGQGSGLFDGGTQAAPPPAATAPATPQQAQQSAPVAGFVNDSVESDEALDAAIAGIMKTP